MVIGLLLGFHLGLWLQTAGTLGSHMSVLNTVYQVHDVSKNLVNLAARVSVQIKQNILI